MKWWKGGAALAGGALLGCAIAAGVMAIDLPGAVFPTAVIWGIYILCPVLVVGLLNVEIWLILPLNGAWYLLLTFLFLRWRVALEHRR